MNHRKILKFVMVLSIWFISNSCQLRCTSPNTDQQRINLQQDEFQSHVINHIEEWNDYRQTETCSNPRFVASACIATNLSESDITKTLFEQYKNFKTNIYEAAYGCPQITEEVCKQQAICDPHYVFAATYEPYCKAKTKEEWDKLRIFGKITSYIETHCFLVPATVIGISLALQGLCKKYFILHKEQKKQS